MKNCSPVICLLLCLVVLSCALSDQEKLSHGQHFASQKKYTEAIAEYTKLINKRSFVQPALYYRGLAFIETGRYREALKDYNKLISLHTVDGLVIAYDDTNPMHQYKADEISPERALFRRGQAHYYIDSLDKALQDFQLCIDHSFSTVSEGHLWQGYVRLKQGDTLNACGAFSSAKRAASDTESLQKAEQMLKKYCLPE